MPIIELSNISKKFGEKVIFENFSVQIDQNKMYAITGKSGCGKSTLLNILGGIEKVTQGDVTICNNKNISSRSRKYRKLLRNKISFLFQNYALADNDTVKYNLEIALQYSRAKNKKQLIADTLKTVDLEGFARQKVYTLSGGEQQRVAMARLLLKPCEIILADEPTGNLDIVNRDKVFSLLQKFAQEGKTVVIATHDLELANRCEERIYLGNELTSVY